VNASSQEPETPTRTVAVVGAGTMGSGIAIVMARAGFRTLLHDADKAGLEHGLDHLAAFLRAGAERGKYTSEEADASIARVIPASSLADLHEADVVVEAIFENLAAKQELFAELDRIVAPTALLHTNTSTLAVTAIAAGSRLPDRVVGTHYCNPAPLMRLVEVAPGRHTATASYERTMRFLGQLGKLAVRTKDQPGFIVNRFLIPWENNVIRALEAGMGTVESIDLAVQRGLGHPMGPFRLLDIVGLDIHREVAMRLYEQLHDARFAPPPLVDRMIAAGDLGRKAGRGFYVYGDNRLFGA
jgi:3-hydroxybutyryl-CoA dehydrogenase